MAKKNSKEIFAYNVACLLSYWKCKLGLRANSNFDDYSEKCVSYFRKVKKLDWNIILHSWAYYV